MKGINITFKAFQENGNFSLNCALVAISRTFLSGLKDSVHCKNQKQSSIGVLISRCSENMQQIYRGTTMPKCDFNKFSLQLYLKMTFRHEHSPVNLLRIFRTPFHKNTYGGLCLDSAYL